MSKKVFISIVMALAGLPAYGVQSRELDIFHELEARVKNSKTVHDFLTKSKHMSERERRFLLSRIDPKQAMPRVEFNYGLKTAIRVEGLEIAFRDPGSGEILVNGSPYVFEKGSVMGSAVEIARLTRKSRKTSGLFFLWWVESAHAQWDSGVDTLCYGDLELTWRDLSSMGQGTAGYLPPLLVANLAEEYIERGMARVASPSCEEQARQLDALLRENRLAIKTLGCGADYRGTDRNLEFWIPEYDKEEEEYKTRNWNLDYKLMLAQEEDSKVTYAFSRHGLTEIRSPILNASECKTMKAGDPEFEKKKKEIEGFRKIFHYIGENRSCLKCPQELRRALENRDEPPTYIKTMANPPPMPPKRPANLSRPAPATRSRR